MFDSFVSLYKRKNMNRNMVLRNKLRSVQISRSDYVTIYLMRITQVHAQIETIQEKTKDTKLVNVALNGISKS